MGNPASWLVAEPVDAYPKIDGNITRHRVHVSSSHTHMHRFCPQRSEFHFRPCILDYCGWISHFPRILWNLECRGHLSKVVQSIHPIITDEPIQVQPAPLPDRIPGWPNRDTRRDLRRHRADSRRGCGGCGRLAGRLVRIAEKSPDAVFRGQVARGEAG